MGKNSLRNKNKFLFEEKQKKNGEKCEWNEVGKIYPLTSTHAKVKSSSS